MQLESARHDLIRLRDQLEAQTESCKVASAQCKSAQTELKTLKQQLMTRSQSSLSEQSSFESAKIELTAQLESVTCELNTQTELSRDSQAALSSVMHELECTKIELVSVGEALRLEKESSKAQVEQVQQQKSKLKTQVTQHTEQLRGAEDELLKARRDSEQLKVSLSLKRYDFRLSPCCTQQSDTASGKVRACSPCVKCVLLTFVTFVMNHL